jgi:hypothetical protein
MPRASGTIPNGVDNFQITTGISDDGLGVGRSLAEASRLEVKVPRSSTATA